MIAFALPTARCPLDLTLLVLAVVAVAWVLMLAVQAEGLGTTWVGWFDPDRVQALFPETADYDLIALFPLGYPAEDAKPSERHFERRSREEAITEL